VLQALVSLVITDKELDEALGYGIAIALVFKRTDRAVSHT